MVFDEISGDCFMYFLANVFFSLFSARLKKD